MAGSWNFGGAFADTAGELQRQDLQAQRAPATLALLEANAGLAKTKAAEAAYEFEAQKRTEDLMRQMSVTGLEQGSAGATKLAEVFAQAGNPNAASTMMVKAAQMQASEAAQKAAEARQAREAATRSVTMGERYSALLGGVRSQQDLDRANMIFMSEFGEEIPPELRQYDPRMVEVVRQSALTQAQRERLELDEQDLARREADSRSLRTLRNAQTAAAEALARQRRDKVDADRKTGGKDIGSPTKMQKDAAVDLLAADGIFEKLSPAEQDVAAYDLASYARGLQRKNPALDFSQALQRAFVEEKTRGAYVTQNLDLLDRARNVVTKDKKPAMRFTPRGAPAAVSSYDQLLKLPKGAKVTISGKMYENLGGGKVRELPGAGGTVVDEEEEE